MIDILIKKLATIGCPLRLIKFVKFLTRERYVYTSVTHEHRHSYKGVPQGGVLSPVLYIIYVSDIVKNIPSNISISQFADDIALYSANQKSLQKAITIIENNLSNIGLNFAP